MEKRAKTSEIFGTLACIFGAATAAYWILSFTVYYFSDANSYITMLLSYIGSIFTITAPAAGLAFAILALVKSRNGGSKKGKTLGIIGLILNLLPVLLVLAGTLGIFYTITQLWKMG